MSTEMFRVRGGYQLASSLILGAIVAFVIIPFALIGIEFDTIFKNRYDRFNVIMTIMQGSMNTFLLHDGYLFALFFVHVITFVSNARGHPSDNFKVLSM